MNDDVFNGLVLTVARQALQIQRLEELYRDKVEEHGKLLAQQEAKSETNGQPSEEALSELG